METILDLIAVESGLFFGRGAGKGVATCHVKHWLGSLKTQVQESGGSLTGCLTRSACNAGSAH